MQDRYMLNQSVLDNLYKIIVTGTLYDTHQNGLDGDDLRIHELWSYKGKRYLVVRKPENQPNIIVNMTTGKAYSNGAN